MGQFTSQGANPMLMQLLQGIFAQPQQNMAMGGMQRPQMQQPNPMLDQMRVRQPWVTDNGGTNVDVLMQMANQGNSAAMNVLPTLQNAIRSYQGSGFYEKNLNDMMGGMSVADADRLAAFSPMSPTALVNPVGSQLGNVISLQQQAPNMGNPREQFHQQQMASWGMAGGTPPVLGAPNIGNPMQAIPSFVGQPDPSSKLLMAPNGQNPFKMKMPKFGEL